MSDTPANTLPTGTASRRGRWSMLIAIVLAVVLLWLAFQGADWNTMLQTVRAADPLYLVAALVIMAGSYVARSLRWRVLLNAAAPTSVLTAFWGTCAGYLGNAFLPARAGELLRTYLISEKTGASKGYVLATALTERLFDAVLLVATMLLLLGQFAQIPEWITGATRTMGIIGLAGALILLAAPRMTVLVERVLTRLPLPTRWSDRIAALITHFLQGFGALQTPGRAFSFTFFTLMAWTLDVILALQIGHAFGVTFEVTHVLLLLAAVGLGSAAPSTPGYIGIYQFVAVTILTPFGYSQDFALVYILAYQLINYTLVTIFGLIGLWMLRK